MVDVRRDREGNEFELRPIACPTCGDVPQRELGLRGGRHQRHGLGIETRVVECSRCSLLFPNPFPFPLRPQQLYGDPEKYFEHHTQAGKIAAYRLLVKKIVQRTHRSNPRILDIGAGRGEFVHAANQEGVTDAYGLEFSDAMIEQARSELGVELVKKSIEQLAAEAPEPYDAVVLNAVIEHVYDPNAFMAAVARVTRRGAVVYIDVPNEPNLMTHVANRLSRLRGSTTVFNLQPTWMPYHVFGFNRTALTALLGKHGFVIDELKAWSDPRVPSTSGLKDRFRSFVGEQVMRIGNWSGMGGNLFVWARKLH